MTGPNPQDQLLDALLPHVPRLGWTRAAVRAGLADLGMPPAQAPLAFPANPFRLIDAWAALNDRRMGEAAEAIDMAALRTPARVRAVFEIRLRLLAPHRQALRSAMALLATPCGLPTAIRIEARAADAMWRAAGDASTDFSRHTRRLTLAAIHTATLAYWLRHDAVSAAEALAFFDRRLAELPKKRRRPGAVPRAA